VWEQPFYCHTHISGVFCVYIEPEELTMAMVRYQMFIDEGQKRTLEEMHRRLNVPVAELVRRAIGTLVAEQSKKTVYPAMDEETGSLLSLAGVCEGGPTDLADSHELYLRGEKTP
jgi:16S rRNA U516 pseudouridylate synthase RsuA-like enzyme